MAKDILKVYGFSKNIIFDELSETEIKDMKKNYGKKYGVAAFVFPDVKNNIEIEIISYDGNINFIDGNITSADGNIH